MNSPDPEREEISRNACKKLWLAYNAEIALTKEDSVFNFIQKGQGALEIAGEVVSKVRAVSSSHVKKDVHHLNSCAQRPRQVSAIKEDIDISSDSTAVPIKFSSKVYPSRKSIFTHIVKLIFVLSIIMIMMFISFYSVDEVLKSVET